MVCYKMDCVEFLLHFHLFFISLSFIELGTGPNIESYLVSESHSNWISGIRTTSGSVSYCPLLDHNCAAMSASSALQDTPANVPRPTPATATETSQPNLKPMVTTFIPRYDRWINM